MTDNIFLAIENYLADPTPAAAQQIHVISNKMAKEAHDAAVKVEYDKFTIKINKLDKKIKDAEASVRIRMSGLIEQYVKLSDDLQAMRVNKAGGYQSTVEISALEGKIKELQVRINENPLMKEIETLKNDKAKIEKERANIAVGSDDFMKKMFKIVKNQVKEAKKTSTRFVRNNGDVTATDPRYIFRLSEDEQKQIAKLTHDAVDNAKSSGNSPHGLVWAFNGYIERRGESKGYLDRLSNAEQVVVDAMNHVALAGSELQEAELAFQEAERELSELMPVSQAHSTDQSMDEWLGNDLKEALAHFGEDIDKPVDEALLAKQQEAQTRLERAQADMQLAESNHDGVVSKLRLAEEALQEVQKTKPEQSNIPYCDKEEADIRKHNTLLRLKVEDLESRGEKFAAGRLKVAQEQITTMCKHYPSNRQEMAEFKKKLAEPLISAKESSDIKEHRGVMEILTNFLLVVSVVGAVYLATTANQRGSFFHHSETDTAKKIGKMAKAVGHEEKPPQSQSDNSELGSTTGDYESLDGDDQTPPRSPTSI